MKKENCKKKHGEPKKSKTYFEKNIKGRSRGKVKIKE